MRTKEREVSPADRLQDRRNVESSIGTVKQQRKVGNGAAEESGDDPSLGGQVG
jgi:hypothetical protein